MPYLSYATNSLPNAACESLGRALDITARNSTSRVLASVREVTHSALSSTSNILASATNRASCAFDSTTRGLRDWCSFATSRLVELI